MRRRAPRRPGLGRLRVRARDYAYALQAQVQGLLPDDAAARRLEVPPGGGPGRVPVVLLPGIYEPWQVMAPLAWALHDAGHPVHVLRTLGRQGAPVGALADAVRAELDERGLTDVWLVAHSKGGLVGKSLLVDDAADALATGAPRRYRGLVAVATPWSGSVLAPLVPLHAVRELGPRAAGLLALAAQTEADADIVAVRPRWDQLVRGASWSVAPAGAREVVLDSDGHFGVMRDPELHRVVLEVLAGERDG